jgi:hypothetical protein
MANRLDGSVCAELLAEAAHTDLDDVRTGIEVVAPDLRQEALAAHDRACVLDEVVEEPELAIRGRPRARRCAPGVGRGRV